MYRYIFIALLGFSVNVFAEIPIKSLRSIFHERGEMYISSGRDDNHSKNAKNLELLWKSNNKITFTDNYQQDWKTISIDEIMFNNGAEAKNYIIFYKNNIGAAAVKSASLFKWGCDDSIVPVLNLGKWPFKVQPYEWGGVAIEIEQEYGLPQIIHANNDFLASIPIDERGLIRDKYFPALELKWIKVPDYQIILVEYEHSNGTYPKELIIIKKDTKEVRILKSKSPFDGRC